ncbi:MAG: hypothetical protein DRN95_01325, partial [Candidatus Hydrothermarchaeota archaeon]
KLYAFEHNGKLLWSFDLNSTIVSITTIDKNNDGMPDYFLVATGTKFYAVKGNETNASILWSYDVGIKISKHISLDFERNLILDDVAFISGNTLYAYDLSRVYLPKINLSVFYIKNEKNLSVTFIIENLGDGNAENVDFTLYLPDKKKSWKGNLTPKEKIEVKSLVTINTGEAINITGKIYYYDIYGRKYSKSKTLTINIENETKQNETTEGVKKEESFNPPKLNVKRVFSKDVITTKENLTIDLIFQNFGGSPALAIAFSDSVPEGFVLVDEKSEHWNGNLEPGETKVITKILSPKDFVKTTNVTIPELTIIYRDLKDEVHKVTLEAKTITVIADEPFWKRYKKFAPIIIIVPLLFFILKKKGKSVPKPKIRKIKLKIKIPTRKKKESSSPNPELEKKFIKIYLEYQAKGKRPTYGDIKRELGISIKEVENIVESVKRKLNP